MTENETLLAAYKKANKERRAKILAKAGYKTEKGYLASLNRTTTPVVSKVVSAKKTTTKVKVKPTIHNVFLLDASGSMSGGKFNAAIAGINSEIEELKKSTTANFTQTIVDFAESNDIKMKAFMVAIDQIEPNYRSQTRGSTALYQAIGETLIKLRKEVKSGEKVLVKIFTDGGENASRGEFASSNTVRALINTCERDGFTITFVGTQNDVNSVSRQLSIDVSNTLVHDNTAQGMQKSFASATRSTVAYSAKVANGEDVLKGFYKTKGEL